MNSTPGSYKAHTPRTTRTGVLALAAVLTLAPIVLDDPASWNAMALGHEECDFLLNECEFDIDLTDWNETGPPGEILNGTLTITNTGSGNDSYTITIAADNTNWTAETDPEETDVVEEEESTTVTINVLIPEDAHMGESTTITITVTSQGDEDEEETLTFDATAGQFHAWSFTCTGEITIGKNQEAEIALSATNAGNGADEASISHAPMPDGFEIQEPETVSADSGQTQEQNVTVGVGIGPDEDDYEIQWTLQSLGDTNTTEACTTMITVVENGPGDDDDDVDTPAPAFGVILAAILLALIARRRERHA